MARRPATMKKTAKGLSFFEFDRRYAIAGTIASGEAGPPLQALGSGFSGSHRKVCMMQDCITRESFR